ncbi:hypothetical protein BDY24DRAFT_388324 [Mrakia frigida]|uniref:uncharacterized protein n=1 Tax=Mrakia frigida TaxID=29902 RepID=UPI003FCC2691
MDTPDDLEAQGKKIWEARDAPKQQAREKRELDIERSEREADDRRERRRRDKEREKGVGGAYDPPAELKDRDSDHRSPRRRSEDGRRSASPVRRRSVSPSSRRALPPRDRSISSSSSATEFGPPRPPPPPSSSSSSRLSSFDSRRPQDGTNGSIGSRRLAESLGVDRDVETKSNSSSDATSKPLDGLLLDLVSLLFDRERFTRVTVSNASTAQPPSSAPPAPSTILSSEARIQSKFKKEGLNALRPRLADLVASFLQTLNRSIALPSASSLSLDSRFDQAEKTAAENHLSWMERMDQMEERMENGEEEEKGRDDAMDGDGAGKAGADDPMVAAVKKFETILEVVEKKMVEFETTWREKTSSDSITTPGLPASLSPQITSLVESLLASSTSSPSAPPPSSSRSLAPESVSNDQSTQRIGNSSPGFTFDGQPLGLDDTTRLLSEMLRSMVGTSLEKASKLEELVRGIEELLGS